MAGANTSLSGLHAGALCLALVRPVADGAALALALIGFGGVAQIQAATSSVVLARAGEQDTRVCEVVPGWGAVAAQTVAADSSRLLASVGVPTSDARCGT